MLEIYTYICIYIKYILCTFLQITCNTDLCFIFMEVKLGYRHPSRFYFSYRPQGAHAPSVSLHVHVPLPPLRPGAAVCPTLCGRRARLLCSPGRKLRAPPPSKQRCAGARRARIFAAPVGRGRRTGRSVGCIPESRFARSQVV